MRTLIVVSAGGTAERTVDVNQIVIPDLWHVAYRLGMDTPDGKAVLEAWHLCHALKDHIQTQIEQE